MLLLAADTKRDQEMIEKFQRAYENLKKIADKRQEEIDRLREELDEYKKRHPATVGVKNGKTYDIASQKTSDQEDAQITRKLPEKRKPGAQPGHKGHFRITSRPTEKVNVRLDLHECPVCHNPLRRKGTRNRIIEDIPVIKPDIVQYRMDRLYCKKCKKVYEPQIPGALPDTTPSLKAMLTVAYFRIGMRMSIENTAATMIQAFGIRMSEGEIQNILSQLTDYLGEAYKTILAEIRDAPSRHMDPTSWNTDSDPYNLWTFLTKTEAIFKITRSNGHDVPLETLKDHNGVDIHDRHSKHSPRRQETHSSIAGHTSYATQRNSSNSMVMMVQE